MAVIKSQFTLRLNLADHAKIKKIAEEENRSITNMIETLVKYSPKKDETGKPVLSEDGKTIMVRPSEEEALKTAYKYQDILAFEADFWQWLTVCSSRMLLVRLSILGPIRSL